MNSPPGSESNNNNSLYYTDKRDEKSLNRYEMENNTLQDGVGIDVMLHVSTLNQYANME